MVDSIKVKLVAKMERVAILLENERRPIADLKVEFTVRYQFYSFILSIFCVILD